ncbi:hypothetical protein BDD12DRAFT_229014 [Trichophaea hybrida]|nr:hypothetical protein BDD12DRAFT_229014 [Trichophaea hybrida]
MVSVTSLMLLADVAQLPDFGWPQRNPATIIHRPINKPQPSVAKAEKLKENTNYSHTLLFVNQSLHTVKEVYEITVSQTSLLAY